MIVTFGKMYSSHLEHPINNFVDLGVSLGGTTTVPVVFVNFSGGNLELILKIQLYLERKNLPLSIYAQFDT